MSQREEEGMREETAPQAAFAEQEEQEPGSPGTARPESGDGETAVSQAGAVVQPRDDERAPLLANEEAERFRRRWEELQAGFVDRPREMVEEADDLVGELMQRLTASFSEERSSLEAQWEKGEDVSTEDLRVALTRYRSFFNRLLSA
jgi:hypothetical protein